MNALEIMKQDKPHALAHFDMPLEYQGRAKKLLKQMFAAEDMKEKQEVMKELFGTCTPMTFVGEGFHCDYGFNCHFHGLTIMNINVCMLDTSPIHIGDGAFIGPNVVFACPNHSLIPEERVRGIGSSAPIFLGDKVWIGANCTILGGVHIGAGSTIAAGSVVTKDIPAGVVAGGVPCRVLREIGPSDHLEAQSF